MTRHTGPLLDMDYRRLGDLLVRPFDAAYVQPASYEVTLAPDLLIPRPGALIDLTAGDTAPHLDAVSIPESGYILEPGACLLAATREFVTCPPNMLATIDGKSTIGRCFVAVHVTAGFIDPGFPGVVTLEIVNFGPWRFLLREGMKIGQLRFTALAREPEVPYGDPRLGSHYQGSRTVRAAAALGAIDGGEPTP